MRLHEIEIGGGVDSSYLDDLNNHDFTHPQRDLFPQIPTLDPHLPKESKMTLVGTLGGLRVARVEPRMGRYGARYSGYNPSFEPGSGSDSEVDYVLFDRNHAVAWAGVAIPPKPNQRPYDLRDETGGQVLSIYIAREFRGQNLGLKFYRWLLSNVVDYLVADELQTWGGVKLWRRALNSRAFDVMVFDPSRGMSRRRWAGKDFEQVYKNYRLIPWMTLRGKADELLED